MLFFTIRKTSANKMNKGGSWHLPRLTVVHTAEERKTYRRPSEFINICNDYLI